MNLGSRTEKPPGTRERGAVGWQAGKESESQKRLVLIEIKILFPLFLNGLFFES
jgi:hypothetical protein